MLRCYGSWRDVAGTFTLFGCDGPMFFAGGAYLAMQ
jgi:hypothetical protein